MINPEIKHLLGESGTKKDGLQVVCQNTLGAAIYALSLALSLIFNDVNTPETELVSLLSDAGRMLSDVHYNVSVMRRAFIIPKVNRKVKDITEDLPIDRLLFGEDLSSRMKATKDVEKNSREFVKPSASKDDKSYTKYQPKKTYNSDTSKISLNSKGSFKKTPNKSRQNRVHQSGPKSRTQTYNRRY